MGPLAFMEGAEKRGGELVNQREGRSRSKSGGMVETWRLIPGMVL